MQSCQICSRAFNSGQFFRWIALKIREVEFKMPQTIKDCYQLKKNRSSSKFGAKTEFPVFGSSREGKILAVPFLTKDY